MSRQARCQRAPQSSAFTRGLYDQLGETYAAMERWIETNGLKTAGPPWESVHH